MTRRIFKSIIAVAAAVIAACFIIILGILYEYFSALSAVQLKNQTSLIAHAVENEGAAYFEGLDAGEYRVTWIAADGSVLYDSQGDAQAMENHSGREEFIEALSDGVGESSRYSSTLTQRMFYCAQRLSDGTVLRLANAQHTIFMLVIGMLQSVAVVVIIAIVISALLASRVAKRIVKPLNELNLDSPLENDAYDELAPLLSRIDRQHRQIAAQEEELLRKQQEWNAVTDSMNEGIVLLGEQSTVLSINKSAARLLETDRGCVGENFLTVCRRIELQPLLQSAAAGGTAECRLFFGEREYQMNSSPVVSEGAPKGTVLLFFDITERLRAEQLRREFTANVSHELKTPLHTISGSAEILKGGLVSPEDAPRFTARIYDEAQRMIKLVDDIIGLSRLDEGEAGAAPENMSLKSAAEAAVGRLEAEASDITLSVTGDEGLINGIPYLIDELIFNLCDNAIKYNRAGGSVSVNILDRPGETVLSVSDTGIGIPPDAQERVFERFYRVDKSHSKQLGGTGLGLSIVKHVALMHSAKITLESTPGEGTTVSVIFPKK